jgi:uncharacterized protein
MKSKRHELRKIILEEVSRFCNPEMSTIRVGPALINAEIADTPYLRDKGLMFRDSLARDQGMLFIFPDCDTRGFWMKNTKIPLSIAFADESGRILNIENMLPYENRSKYSKGPAKYALEVNLGLFEELGINPGSFIVI